MIDDVARATRQHSELREKIAAICAEGVWGWPIDEMCQSKAERKAKHLDPHTVTAEDIYTATDRILSLLMPDATPSMVAAVKNTGTFDPLLTPAAPREAPEVLIAQVIFEGRQHSPSNVIAAHVVTALAAAGYSIVPSALPADTVRVRIAVAVAQDGVQYEALGSHYMNDDELFCDVLERVALGARVSFITADAPKPEKPAEIAGSAE